MNVIRNIMKKIIIMVLILNSINHNAQTVIPLENYDGYPSNSNDYYQDSNNYLNPFIGTWIYQNGNTSLKIVLNKSVMSNVDDEFFSDGIYGEYQYIQNGIQKINTLPNLNILNDNFRKHTIFGNYILNYDDIPICSDCVTSEKRIRLYCHDPLKDVFYTFVLRHKIINGEEKLFMILISDGIKISGNSSGEDLDNIILENVGSTILPDNYILNKFN